VRDTNYCIVLYCIVKESKGKNDFSDSAS